MKIAALIVVLAFFAAGCGGDAEVTIINNTDRYVTGDLEGSTYGLPAGGHTTRSVEVGGFWSSSSDVTVQANVHSTTSASSAICNRLSRTFKARKDEHHRYEVWSEPSAYGAPELRLIEVIPGLPIM
jgi:hypothetical protein